MAPSKDPESGEKKNIKRTLSSGKLLVDDPGWLGPFNRLVWAYPNSILYSLLILGAVIFVLMKQAHHSTNAVRSTRRERPSKTGSFLSTTNATRARSLRRVATRRRLERVRTRAPRRDAPFRRARVAREPSRNSPRAPRGLRPHTARAVCSLLFPPSDGTGAFLFNLFVRARVSPLTRLPPLPPQFVGAAIVEVLLSTDNICLFHQIFEHFRVPREVRPGLLFVGTPFMVLMRWSLFFALKGIYDSLRPLMFALGLFCAYQGLVVFYMTCMGLEEEDEDPENSAMVIWFKKIMGDKLITKYQGSAFHVTLDGIGKYTPMFLVLMFIEVTDVAFCIDGVSTIFMVDHVHVWTLFLGDIVAACIVRALYPQLAGTVELFPDLNYSVACVLVMVGADMCCGVFGYDFPPGTLAVSMGVLFTLGMASSILRGTCRNPDEEDEAAKNKDQGAYGAA